MSIEAMSWVLRYSEERLGRRLVLLVLADHANDDGTGAWPSVETIATKARMSRAQTQRCLRALEVAGSVEKVGKSSAGTVVYNVVMGGPQYEAGASNTTGEGASNTTQPRGVNEARTTLKQPPIEPSVNLAAAVPKAVRIGGRDLPFDALAEVCGIRAGSPRARAIPKSLNGEEGIRAQAWAEAEFRLAHEHDPEVFEHWLSERIHERAAAYRAAMPGAALTPTALAKWWTDLPGMAPARDGRSGSGAEVVDAVDAAVRRERERSQ